MKKVLLIITCLWCSLCVSANPIHVSASMNYTSTYKGSGRSGMVHSAPIRSTAMGNSVMAQAPVAAMGSTGISMGSGAATSETAAAPQVRGIYTSASNIVGGVTTYDSGQRNAPGRRNTEVTPGKPGECHCEDLNNDGFCDHCGAEYDEFDGGCSNDPCWCPLDLNRTVMLFFALLTAAYAVYKKRTSTLR
ncbi:MAG: hypothetical protein II825_02365 [Paludibacteraceae bacterium]|nr:hypothetical protein [Paludibacteraceae bacterium]